jgi:hypothetical protein
LVSRYLGNRELCYLAVDTFPIKNNLQSPTTGSRPNGLKKARKEIARISLCGHGGSFSISITRADLSSDGQGDMAKATRG